MKNIYKIGLLSTILVLFSISFVLADANWEVTTFSCSPEEVAVGNDFSCTAQIENTGDTTGTLSTATLYPDASNWLEESSYAITANAVLDSGESTEVTFTNLRASLSGENGFSKMMLDSITDTAGVEDVAVNAINVLVSLEESASSLLDGSDSEITATVIAGGSIDVDLSFSGDSGCAINNQDNTKTISGMDDGESTSRKWTVTVSSSDCTYTITAAATGVNGIGSKSDSTSSTIDCTDCTEDSGSPSSSPGGSSPSSSSPGGSTTTGDSDIPNTPIDPDTEDSLPPPEGEGLGKPDLRGQETDDISSKKKKSIFTNTLAYIIIGVAVAGMIAMVTIKARANKKSRPKKYRLPKTRELKKSLKKR